MHRALRALLCGLLVVLGVGLLVSAATLKLSHHAAAIGSPASSIRSVAAPSPPIETIVPTRGLRLDWRLKPSLGLGPASTLVLLTSAAAGLCLTAASARLRGRHADDLRTRAPPT